MQIKRENLTPTSIKMTVIADQAAIDAIKQFVLNILNKDIKLPGFRSGKVPANLLEKQVDQSVLQNEFLNEAVNQLYDQAVKSEGIRVVAKPEISITKFVPFSALEFTAELQTVGPIKLGDYKKIKMTAKKIEISAQEVNVVVENLRERAAEKKDVNRAAKIEDEVTIDFKGVDAKTKEPIEGAEGSDYPLVIGSKSFIPGFEEELIGLKPKDEKTFKITFPKDYGAPGLQNRVVNFSVNIKKVQELAKPKADDAFAAKVGPFKTVVELKADIKKQLLAEKQSQANQAFDNDLLQKIADQSEVAIPESLIEEEITRLEEDERRNITYRGQTWQEHLDEEGITAEAHREKQKPLAETRIKVGLILGEIAEKENVQVTGDELETRLEQLRSQYTDEAMLAELEKPENRRDIFSRIMIEKTIERLHKSAKTK